MTGRPECDVVQLESVVDCIARIDSEHERLETLDFGTAPQQLEETTGRALGIRQHGLCDWHDCERVEQNSMLIVQNEHSQTVFVHYARRRISARQLQCM